MLLVSCKNCALALLSDDLASLSSSPSITSPFLYLTPSLNSFPPRLKTPFTSATKSTRCQASTFPSTGIYKIEFDTVVYITNATSRYVESFIYATTNNSSYSEASRCVTSLYDSDSNTYGGTHCNFLFDVTNVSTHKVYFRQLPANSNVYTVGNTNRNFTYMTFMRIGDT